MVALLGTKQQHLLSSTLTLPKIYDHLPPPSPDYFESLGLPACVHVISIYYLVFSPYDGYYSETDRTGTVQKTIPSLKYDKISNN